MAGGGVPTACYPRAGTEGCYVLVVKEGVSLVSMLVLLLAKVALVWGLGICPLLLAGLLALCLTLPPLS